ncbi:MAG: HEPN domain-containing protein [Bacteroidetes bacterium]|nr:HEPN domain-containing protein [Bacteroidota bacterium]MBU2585844.1 HEPN domain-containing protein [Bacteroidota bacterium]
MDEKQFDIAKYRIEKAKEEILSAKILMEKYLIKSALSSLYYSMFHSVRALLALEGTDSKTHSGIIHLFHDKFIHTGKLDKNLGKILSNAFELRLDSDYQDFYVIGKDEVNTQVNNAELFYKEIVRFIEKHYGKKLE